MIRWPFTSKDLETMQSFQRRREALAQARVVAARTAMVAPPSEVDRERR